MNGFLDVKASLEYLQSQNSSVEKPEILTDWLLPEARAGEYYEYTLSASGAQPITWDYSKKPATAILDRLFELTGLKLDSTGKISGTPYKYETGLWSFHASATNAYGYDEKEFYISITDGQKILIDASHFPDAAFREYVSNFDTDGDGSLSDEEIANVEYISVYGKNISSLSGIEYFTALTYLYCPSNQLTTLDVSKNTALTYLSCWGNGMTSLNVNGAAALYYLDCAPNLLTELDVSTNTALENLYCYSNQLTKLDVSKNTALQYLYCGNNQLTALDVSNNIALQDLLCDNNQLTALDVSKNSALQTLACYSNQLTTLDVRNNTALTYLDCDSNQLTTLDVSRCTKLETLYCNNQLMTLDVSKNSALTYLYCGNNQLTTLDVSKNSALKELWCYNNQLAELDVSHNTALTYLDCDNNQLTELDVSRNTALTTLYCSGNQLAELDVSHNTALTELRCSYNQLTTLDVSSHSDLTLLYCYNNNLEQLILGSKPALTDLRCDNNQLTVLDITGCPAFTTFYHDSDVLIIDSSTVLNITTISLAQGKTGAAYSDTLTANLTGVTWSIVDGSLPNGLSLNSATGEISGNPANGGNFSFTANAAIASLATSKEFTLSISGHGTDTPITEPADPPEFKSYKAVLEGQIVLYFYALLPENDGIDYTNSYVTFKVLNDTTYNQPQYFDPEITMQGKYGTYYGFKCYLTSIQMADQITAVLHYGDGYTVEKQYTLKQYIDKLYSASSGSPALINILEAMKDYGYYAQIALEEYNGWTLGVDHTLMDCVNVYTAADVEKTRQAVKTYAMVKNNSGTGVKSVGYNLALDSDTTLKLYLRPADGYTGNIFAYSRGVVGITDENVNLAVKQPDGRYLVEISGIPAHKLDYMNSIHVTTDKGDFDIKVSALSYVYTILNSTSYNDNMKKAVTSLYKYCRATQAYRTSTGQ